MSQIDVDDDVLEHLKANAEPFVDTPNTVLRRLLGIDGRTAVKETGTSRQAQTRKSHDVQARGKRKNVKPARTRAASGTLLPEERYETPMLRALVEAGGQAPYREIVDAVGRELKDDLLPADFESLNSGAIRWQSRLQFVRLRLIERGFLDKDTPRGIWGITEAGRQALKEASS